MIKSDSKEICNVTKDFYCSFELSTFTVFLDV